jgi:hypothetical protein
MVLREAKASDRDVDNQASGWKIIATMGEQLICGSRAMVVKSESLPAICSRWDERRAKVVENGSLPAISLR